MRDERGQGTIEYLAVVLLVALVMAAAAAALVVSGIGPAVVREIRHALCVVTGGACGDEVRLAERPCVVAADRHAQGGHVEVSFVRIGDRSVVVRERLADGRYRLTFVYGVEGGIDVGTHVDAHVRWGGFERAVGVELRMAVLAEHASGRTWTVPDAATADRVLEAAELAQLHQRANTTIPDAPTFNLARPEVHVPEADVTFTERGSDLDLDFRVRGLAGVRLSYEDAYGERTDRVSGERTVYVRSTVDGRGRVAFGRSGFGVSGQGRGEERYAVTLDRDGRPVDLMVLSTLDVQGAVGLPSRLSRIAGLLRIPTSGEKHVETEQHLDLTDPVSAGLARRFLADLGGRLGVAATARALRDRLDEAGTLSVRTYATDETVHEAGAHAKVLGLGLGGEGGTEDSSSRLVAAVARRPDGTWGVDEACAAV